MRKYDDLEIAGIIKHYHENFKEKIDLQMDFCLAQTTLNEAIVVAAKAIDATGKVHFHQRRIAKIELEKFAIRIAGKEDKILAINTFEGLYKLIDAEANREISELTVYDTALRIGNFLKIYPEKIYLQTGTKAGAEVLLGNLGDRRTLKIEDFPEAFQNESLKDLEEILYEYKGQLKFCVLWD
jgi:hypothetical protein